MRKRKSVEESGPVEVTAHTVSAPAPGSCCNCGEALVGTYLRAMTVVVGTRAMAPKPIAHIPGEIGLCRQCAGQGVGLAVELEWRQVGQ